MKLITIGELSELSGVPASTIRYWESTGLLPAPERSGGQRRYSKRDDCARLALLKLAQDCGFALTEMKALFQGFKRGASPSSASRESARRKAGELEVRIDQLKELRRLLKKAAAGEKINFDDAGRRLLERSL